MMGGNNNSGINQQQHDEEEDGCSDDRKPPAVDAPIQSTRSIFFGDGYGIVNDFYFDNNNNNNDTTTINNNNNDDIEIYNNEEDDVDRDDDDEEALLLLRETSEEEEDSMTDIFVGVAIGMTAMIVMRFLILRFGLELSTFMSPFLLYVMWYGFTILSNQIDDEINNRSSNVARLPAALEGNEDDWYYDVEDCASRRTLSSRNRKIRRKKKPGHNDDCDDDSDNFIQSWLDVINFLRNSNEKKSADDNNETGDEIPELLDVSTDMESVDSSSCFSTSSDDSDYSLRSYHQRRRRRGTAASYGSSSGRSSRSSRRSSRSLSPSCSSSSRGSLRSYSSSNRAGSCRRLTTTSAAALKTYGEEEPHVGRYIPTRETTIKFADEVPGQSIGSVYLLNDRVHLVENIDDTSDFGVDISNEDYERVVIMLLLPTPSGSTAKHYVFELLHVAYRRYSYTSVTKLLSKLPTMANHQTVMSQRNYTCLCKLSKSNKTTIWGKGNDMYYNEECTSYCLEELYSGFGLQAYTIDHQNDILVAVVDGYTTQQMNTMVLDFIHKHQTVVHNAVKCVRGYDNNVTTTTVRI